MEPHGYSHLICFLVYLSVPFLLCSTFGFIFPISVSFPLLEPECISDMAGMRKGCDKPALPADNSLALLTALLQRAWTAFCLQPVTSCWHIHAQRGPKVNAGRGKAGGLLVWLGCDVAASTPATYQRHRL